MGHDANKVALGSTQSSFKTVDNIKGDIAAGLAVTLDSSGDPSLTLADGTLIGVSLGKDMANAGRSAICRRGTRVPIRLENASVNPVIGAQVQVHATAGVAVASGTAVNATYASGELDCILEDGSVVTDGCALIDFPGGL